MNSSWKKSLALLLVLIVGAWYAYKVEYLGKKSSEEATEKEKKLFQFPQGDVDKIAITSPDKKIEMIKQNDGWKITSPIEAKGDAREIDGMLEAAFGASASETVDGNPKDFGLDPARLQVDFYRGGNPETLFIGVTSPTRSFVYAKTSRTGKMALVNISVSNGLSKTMYQLRSKRLVEGNPEEIGKFEVWRGNLHISLEKGADGKWLMTSPINAPADEREIKNLISGFMLATALDFADDKTEAETGLKNPSATVALWKGNTAQRLAVGSETKGTPGFYAKLEGGKTIAVISDALFRQIPQTADALRDKMVFSVFENEIRKISLKYPGAELELERGKDGTWKTSKGQATFETDKAGKLSYSLASATIGGFVGEKEFQRLAKPAGIDITVTTTTGPNAVSFRKGADGKTAYGADIKGGRFFSFDPQTLKEALAPFVKGNMADILP